MHPLLARQLKRHFGGSEGVPVELLAFVGEVDAAYRKADEDHALVSRTLDEMSRELNERHETLKRDRDCQADLAKRLEEAHNQLLQSEKMASIGQLAAGVAHEINNPIGFVNSNLNTLGDYLEDFLELLAAYDEAASELPPPRRDAIAALCKRLDVDYLKSDLMAMLEESREGINRVKKIVQDLKDFSHPDESAVVWADLHQNFDSTLNIVTNEVKYKADVVKDYGDIPHVECLPSQLNQVFMNLLVNAAQAMDDTRRGTITVRTRRDGEHGVRVEVADTGSGIPPENLKRIFDPFFTTKPIGKGTGLGLSLSYGIVQKHHGRLEVESEMGVGTTFRIHLPVRQPAAE